MFRSVQISLSKPKTHITDKNKPNLFCRFGLILLFQLTDIKLDQMIEISSIQSRDRKVEIRREGYPENIWNKEQPRGLRDAVKENGVDDYDRPQCQDPDERKGVPSEIEEPDAPEEIERKSYGKNRQGGSQFVLRRSRIDNEIKRYAHKSEKDRPYDGEEPSGRREGRLLEGGEIVHTAHRQKCGQTSYGKWDRQTYYQ